MYTIEPMPHKLKFSFETGASLDQAFIGNPYYLDVDFELQESVQLKSLKVTLVDIETTSLGQINQQEALTDSTNDSNFSSTAGMVSVDLSAKKPEQLNPSSSATSTERLSTSMFSSDVAKFSMNRSNF